MKIPKKIKVCGVDYDVDFVDDLHIKNGLEGQCQANQCRLMIQNKNYNKQRVEQIFFHELLHAIDDAYTNGSLTENQVNSLSNGIYQVLIDNKMLK